MIVVVNGVIVVDYNYHVCCLLAVGLFAALLSADSLSREFLKFLELRALCKCWKRNMLAACWRRSYCLIALEFEILLLLLLLPRGALRMSQRWRLNKRS